MTVTLTLTRQEAADLRDMLRTYANQLDSVSMVEEARTWQRKATEIADVIEKEMPPAFTKQELYEIAARNGIVQWLPSRKVERLSLTTDGRILACPLAGSMRWHELNPEIQTFTCKEVSPTENVNIGDCM